MKKTSHKPVALHFYFEYSGFRTPGGNKIKKMPSWKYRKVRENIRRILTRFLYETYVSAGLKRPSFQQAKLICTYIATAKRKRDYDNLAFSFKPWLDELQELNILAGDDTARIGDPEYRVEVGEKYGVRIEIEEK